VTLSDRSIVDPYGGPGGWSEGLRTLGLTDVGIEWDAAACATRAAAGHRTIRADVATFPLDHLVGRVDGAILSPPCQAFSTAGTGEGRDVVPELAAAIRRGDWRWSHTDDRVRHVLEVGRWAETLRPRWVACEQVPPVLPLWQAYADRWRALYGWSVWCGILNAADYGVPQTRRRAFLIARTDGQPVAPPAPTHTEGGALTMFGELKPWVSLVEALGWDEDVELHHIRGAGMTERHGDRPGRPATEPAPTIEGGSYRRMAVLRTNQDSQIRKGVTKRYERTVDRPAPTPTQMGRSWVWDQPATTVAGDPRITARCHHDAGSQGANAVTVEQAMTGDYDGKAPIKLTIRDALILQGFDPDYPVQGTRTAQFRQIGDAVPPPLAAAVIAAVTGTSAARRAA